MAYYNKSGNVVTLKDESNLSRFVLLLLFQLPIVIFGWCSILIIRNLMQEGIDKNDSSAFLQVEVLMILGFCLIIVFFGVGMFRVLKRFRYPIKLELILENRVIKHTNSENKEVTQLAFTKFNLLTSDLILVEGIEWTEYYYRQFISGDEYIIFLKDKRIKSGGGFGHSDLLKIAKEMNLETKFEKRWMKTYEYIMFRKNELEAQKNDPRKKYYLSHK